MEGEGNTPLTCLGYPCSPHCPLDRAGVLSALEQNWGNLLPPPDRTGVPHLPQTRLGIPLPHPYPHPTFLHRTCSTTSLLPCGQDRTGESPPHPATKDKKSLFAVAENVPVLWPLRRLTAIAPPDPVNFDTSMISSAVVLASLAMLLETSDML